MERAELDRLLREAIGWPTPQPPTDREILDDLRASLRRSIERRKEASIPRKGGA